MLFVAPITSSQEVLDCWDWEDEGIPCTDFVPDETATPPTPGKCSGKDDTFSQESTGFEEKDAIGYATVSPDLTNTQQTSEDTVLEGIGTVSYTWEVWWCKDRDWKNAAGFKVYKHSAGFDSEAFTMYDTESTAFEKWDVHFEVWYQCDSDVPVLQCQALTRTQAKEAAEAQAKLFPTESKLGTFEVPGALLVRGAMGKELNAASAALGLIGAWKMDFEGCDLSLCVEGKALSTE